MQGMVFYYIIDILFVIFCHCVWVSVVLSVRPMSNIALLENSRHSPYIRIIFTCVSGYTTLLNRERIFQQCLRPRFAIFTGSICAILYTTSSIIRMCCARGTSKIRNTGEARFTATSANHISAKPLWLIRFGLMPTG